MTPLAVLAVALAADPGVKDFAAPGATLEKLWGDGAFTEGPTPGPDGAIYFSDIGNRIMKFDPTSGKTTTFRDPSKTTSDESKRKVSPLPAAHRSAAPDVLWATFSKTTPFRT